MARGSYSDMRFMYMRGLMYYEKEQRRLQYLQQSAEWTSKAIVSLELAEEPVKSVNQAARLQGIGDEIRRRLKTFEGRHYSREAPPGGKFVSSAGAILVTLLNNKEKMVNNGESPVVIPELVIKEEAERLCEESFLDGEGFCSAWWRMNVLCSRGLVKKRSLKKQAVYELLDAGEDIARRLRGPVGDETQGNEILSHATKTRTDFIHNNIATKALYTNDTGDDELVLLVDTQEWGGDRMGLGQLTDLLGEAGVCYRTQKLQSGDYAWLWRSAGKELTLPLLVERKRADDLSVSLVDKRYGKQKERMLAWRDRFRERGVCASLKYLIEGDPALYVVRCNDGCGGVAKCGYPTVKQIQVVLQDLDRNPEFDLLRTDNVQGTIELLTIMTAELQQRLENGDFAELLTLGDIGNNVALTTDDETLKGKSGRTLKSRKRHTSRKAENDESLSSPAKMPGGHDQKDVAGIVSGNQKAYKTFASSPKLKLKVSYSSPSEENATMVAPCATQSKGLPLKRQATAVASHRLPSKSQATTMALYGSPSKRQATSVAEYASPSKRQATTVAAASRESNRGHMDVNTSLAHDRPLAQYHSVFGNSVGHPSPRKGGQERGIIIEKGVIPCVNCVYKPEADSPQKSGLTRQQHQYTAAPPVGGKTNYDLPASHSIVIPSGSHPLQNPSSGKRMNYIASPSAKKSASSVIDRSPSCDNKNNHDSIMNDRNRNQRGSGILSSPSGGEEKNQSYHGKHITSLSSLEDAKPKAEIKDHFKSDLDTSMCQLPKFSQVSPKLKIPSKSTGTDTSSMSDLYNENRCCERKRHSRFLPAFDSDSDEAGTSAMELKMNIEKRLPVESKTTILSDSDDSLPDLDTVTMATVTKQHLSSSPHSFHTNSTPSESTDMKYVREILEVDKKDGENFSVKRKSSTLSRESEKVQSILAILPHVSREMVIETLSLCDFNVEFTLSRLLDTPQTEEGQDYIDLTDSQ